MANIWLPGDGDLALAQREPNLLVPGAPLLNKIEVQSRYAKAMILAANFGAGFTNISAPEKMVLSNSVLARGVLSSASGNDGAYIHSDDVGSLSQSTIGTRFRLLSTGNRGGFIGHNSNARTNGNCGYTDASKWYFLNGGSSNYTYQFSTARAPNDGDWHTVIMSLDSGRSGNEKCRIYIDGVRVNPSWNLTPTGVLDFSGGLAHFYLQTGEQSTEIDTQAVFITAEAIDEQECIALCRNINLLFESANQSPFLIGVAGGGAVDLTPAVEIDSAIALSGAKASTLGVSSETDTAVALSSEKRADLGAAVEADSAQALDHQKVAALSPALETDAAQAISYGMSVSLGVASEADTAPSLSVSKHVAIGTAAETDAAVALSTAQGATLGTAIESDAAQALSTERHSALGIAQETDAAVSLTYGNTASLNPALETDSANAITYRKVAALGTAIEADQAQSLATAKASALGIATETDSALPLVPSTGVSITPATETDTALAISGQRISTLGAATELDLAVTLAWDVVQPGVDIFQSAADVLINALGKARAQTIVLSLESGAVRLEDDDGNPTAYMRKRPNDWNTPDGRMTGSGWQIVCKGWEIADSDIESISGRTATIAGKQYFVVAATPRTSGSLVLDLGYANT